MKRAAQVAIVVVVAGALGILAARLLVPPKSAASDASTSTTTPPASASATVATSSAASSPAASPAGYCGTVKDSLDDNVTVQVSVTRGTTSCSEAKQVANDYYNDPAYEPQGSAGVSTFNGWTCESTSGSDAQNTGHYGDCTNGGAYISLDESHSA